MRRLTLAAAPLAVVLFLARPTSAEVVVMIDKSAQRMSVSIDGSGRYTWPVSTGLHGGPPAGTYRPSGSNAPGIRASSVCPRCRIRSFSTRAMPFTGQSMRPASAPARLMAVYGCCPQTPRPCSRWSRRRGLRTLGSSSSARRAVSGRRRREGHRNAIHAIAKTSRFRPIVEDMAEMATAATAVNFGASHSK
jgi:hypothetical protein